MVLEGLLGLCNRKNAIFVILCAAAIYVHLTAKADEGARRRGREDASRFLIALQLCGRRASCSR